MASKWIYFEEILDTGKTKVWRVRSKLGNYNLGLVKWHGPWRQYCFLTSTDSDTIWNAECMEELIYFIDSQMLARKKVKNV